jgi:putative ubiquitin-RnfH superfamily antitoxin RatB of RatAB toxin-antitoxin module
MLLGRASCVLIASAGFAVPGLQLASAQTSGRLTGRVRDSLGAPLLGALVSVKNSPVSATTSDSGAFTLALEAGSHVVTVRRVGYAMISDSVSMSEGGALTREYKLSARVRTLDAIEVERPLSASMRVFEERRARQQGAFITSAELRDGGNRQLQSLLMRRLPGVTFVPYRGASFVKSSRGGGSIDRRMQVRAVPNDLRSPTGCWLQVYQDGAKIYAPTGQAEAPNINEFQVRDIEAIEFYSGANTPPEFSSSWATCGTLVLWTRLP